MSQGMEAQIQAAADLSSACMLVAVYGSLKRGESNHHWLGDAPYGGCVDLAGLQLYDLGPYPMAVASGLPSDRVQVELYAVSAQQLAQLDRLEDHPRDYQRRLLRLDDGREAWVYLGRLAQVHGYPRLEQGHWSGGA
jgi:gamma-glutamylcyclotransferase (GGCT)/AIG2-like uncharacterized protein YtfP